MIYFLQSVDGGPVKIGTTVNLDVRRKALEAHYGTSLVLLAAMEGGRDEEREIHAKFSHLRIKRTEQFRPDGDLMRFIGRPEFANATEVREMDVVRRHYGTPVRLTQEAVKWARIASGYTGESLSEYVSRIVVERARADAERIYAELLRAMP